MEKGWWAADDVRWGEVHCVADEAGVVQEVSWHVRWFVLSIGGMMLTCELTLRLLGNR